MQMKTRIAITVAVLAALAGGLVITNQPTQYQNVADPETAWAWECQGRVEQGVGDLSPEAREWLRLCVEAFRTSAPSPTPTIPATPAPTSATPSPSTSQTMTASPSSSSPSATALPPSPTITASPSTGTPNWPTPSTTGVGSTWTPTTTRGTLVITQAGTYENIRVNGSVEVRANNVILRNVHIAGGRLWNEYQGRCYSAQYQNVSVTPPIGQTYTSANVDGAVGPGGFIADNLLIQNRVEGVRVGGKQWPGCEKQTVITNSYIGIHPERSWCRSVDWHGDGIQGYGGGPLKLYNVVIEYQGEGCATTGPFFYPHSQGNTSVGIDRLRIVATGFGGYAFRLGMPGTVTNLEIVEGSWGYGPIDVKCSVARPWSAQIVTAAGTPVRNQPCNTEGGN